jgi:hypothetical protein
MTLLPNGVAQENRKRSHVCEIDSVYVPGISNFAKGHPHHNTFSVIPKHEKLQDASGIKFNVETVPDPFQDDMKKNKLSQEEIRQKIKEHAAAFYSGDTYHDHESPKDMRIEAMADTPDTMVLAGGCGFFAACLAAFAQHLPLALSPDHMWSVISFAFAKHVDENAEELRSNFVQHDGKKRIEVQADNIVMGGGNAGSGSSSQEWEDTVFPNFSKQIKNYIGEKVHGAIASDFSTTTSTARAAHEITLMSSMKNYFSYGISTSCGIPNITLLGSEEDWVALRARAESLGDLMTVAFSKMWMPILLPVLDEFVESYKGNVNHGFWQSMVKLRGVRMGSGDYDFISGWLQILFPYLKNGKLNTRLRPWHEMYFDGPKPEEIPFVTSAAPVDWKYYGTTYNLHFHAGIIGCIQNSLDGTLMPVNGWFVTHDPEKEPDVRLKVVQSEIEALLKGHADEAQKVPLNKKVAWYKRVEALHWEQQELESQAHEAKLERKLEDLYDQRNFDEYYKLEEKLTNMCSDDEKKVATEDMIKSFFLKKE